MDEIATCNPAFATIFGFDSIEEAAAANFMELLRSRKDGVELLRWCASKESWIGTSWR